MRRGLRFSLMGPSPHLHDSRKTERKRELSQSTTAQPLESAALRHRIRADRSMRILRCRLLVDGEGFILVNTLAVNRVARSRRHGRK